MDYSVVPSALQSCSLSVPGDKSVSHRALMLAAIAEGTSTISGLLVGDDCLATVNALRQMGVTIDRPEDTTAVVHGKGPGTLDAPDNALDLGNSGTAMRLFAGLLAGQRVPATLSGDESLSRRPMKRVITPLSMMGASISSESGTPPLTIGNTDELRGLNYTLPVASAQVKSALLLAGLHARGETYLVEPGVSRDHTERMLRTMGASLMAEDLRIRLPGEQSLTAADISVPADLSSAAFLLLAALLAEDAEITVRGVGVNPTRTGVIEILREMGGNIRVENPRMMGEEPVADLIATSSALRAVTVPAESVSLAIDEFPVIFVAAAAAEGISRFHGLEELRVKESDRVTAMVQGLRALGVTANETADGAEVLGGPLGGGHVDSQGDHRIAMAFAVAAAGAAEPVRITNVAAVDTSFPGFLDTLRSAGLGISLVRGVDV